MSRSFGIVEDKIEESEFFLQKIEEALTNGHIGEAQFYLSAFLSASRSITFALQASLNDLKGFSKWYKTKQDELKKDQLAKFFLEARNTSQKIGYYPIGGSSSKRDENGKYEQTYIFQYIPQYDYTPDCDVREGCKIYFKTLLEIIRDCYVNFGEFIDPEKFFTYKNLLKTGKSIEDFEQQAGYPAGWTKFDGFSVEDRINLISKHHPGPPIDWIFEKYLGTDRYGNEC